MAVSKETAAQRFKGQELFESELADLRRGIGELHPSARRSFTGLAIVLLLLDLTDEDRNFVMRQIWGCYFPRVQ